MTEPVTSGICEKCECAYEVWGFDSHGNDRYCTSCHSDLQTLDRTGCPKFTKPLKAQEKVVMDTLMDELGLEVWEAKWRCYLYWP